MIGDQVRSLCHQMGLFGFHQSAERRAGEASASQLAPLEFLRPLLEYELLAWRERTAKTLPTLARSRSQAALEDWDQSFDRGLPKAKDPVNSSAKLLPQRGKSIASRRLPDFTPSEPPDFTKSEPPYFT